MALARTNLSAAMIATYLASGRAAAAEPQGAETEVVVSNPRYGASWPCQLVFGGQWRDDWTTPIQVRKLDLATFDGGLTPSRRGGGPQTKNLPASERSARSSPASSG